MDIEELRKLLDKYINVADLTDEEVLRIYEQEAIETDSFLFKSNK